MSQLAADSSKPMQASVEETHKKKPLPLAACD
jgi:hypothetical protein